MADFYIFNNGLMTANTMSGSDRRALNWSRIFLQRGHRIRVFTSESGSERFRKLGFDVFISGSVYLKSNIGLFLIYLSRAVKSCILQLNIKHDRTDIIYSSSDLLADSLPAVFMKLKNPSLRLVIGMHLIAPNPLKGFKKSHTKHIKLPSLANLYYFISQRALLFVLKKINALVLVSNHIDRDFLLKKGFQQSKVLVTYGACDACFKETAIREPKLYDAIYIGRFHEQKGFPDLLKVWKQVTEKLPAAKLIVLGEDIAAGDIRSFIQRNKLEGNINFLGFMDGQQKYGYIKSAKICIFPSYYESFGMVALEAMSCGVPVVAYDLPVYRQIYTNGMARAPIGDINEMAKIAFGLITDEQKRARLSDEALIMSRHFSWKITAAEVLKNLGMT